MLSSVCFLHPRQQTFHSANPHGRRGERQSQLISLRRPFFFNRQRGHYSVGRAQTHSFFETQENATNKNHRTNTQYNYFQISANTSNVSLQPRPSARLRARPPPALSVSHPQQRAAERALLARRLRAIPCAAVEGDRWQRRLPSPSLILLLALPPLRMAARLVAATVRLPPTTITISPLSTYSVTRALAQRSTAPP